MKTVFHATIDGHEIVLGFGDPHIAPVETFAIVEPLLREIPAWKALAAALAEIQRLRVAQSRLKVPANASPQHTWTPAQQQAVREWNELAVAVTAIELRLPELVSAFEEAKRAMVIEHAVYFHPREGEDIITEEQHAELSGAWAELRDGFALKLDGTLVPDLRGRTYWRCAKGVWERQDITALGREPVADSIAEAKLTGEQRQEIAEQADAERVAMLTPEERESERDAALWVAIAQAGQMRSELEIAGDAKALAKSQAWYAEEAARIAEKYG